MTKTCRPRRRLRRRPPHPSRTYQGGLPANRTPEQIKLLKKVAVLSGDYQSCPLCLKRFSGTIQSKKMVYDHCWKCGEFRGWVCSKCNRSIPRFWARLRSFAWKTRVQNYLRAHSCLSARLAKGQEQAKPGKGAYA